MGAIYQNPPADIISVLDRVRPGVDLRFILTLVAINGVSLEEAVAISKGGVAEDARKAEPSGEEAPRRRAKKPPIFERQPPDDFPFARAECARALGMLLQRRIRAHDAPRLACAAAAAMTQELVTEGGELLARLAPCDARAFIQDAIYPENRRPDAADESREEAPCVERRQQRRAVAAAGAAVEGGEGGKGGACGERAGLPGWWQRVEAVGASMIRSLVQALDDEAAVVRAAASRALVEVALDQGLEQKVSDDGGLESGDRGAGRGLWHSVVVGELLQRIARAGPRAISTVKDGPAARLLPAASGDVGALVWMDASAGGVSTAASLQCLIRIFRDCRLDIHGGEGGGGREGEWGVGRGGGIGQGQGRGQ